MSYGQFDQRQGGYGGGYDQPHYGKPHYGGGGGYPGGGAYGYPGGGMPG